MTGADQPAYPTCPRCQQPDPGPLECPRCGVVLAKAAKREGPRPVPAPTAGAPAFGPRREGRNRRLDLGLALVLAVGLGLVARSYLTVDPPVLKPRASPAVPVALDDAPMDAGPGPEAEAAPDPDGPTEPVTPAAPAVANNTPLSPEDQARLNALRGVLVSGAAFAPSDVYKAEELWGRHPQVPEVLDVLTRILDWAARLERQQGRPDEAVRYLERLTDLRPVALDAWRGIVDIHLGQRRFRDAEQALRRALSSHRQEMSLHMSLAHVLTMQDRNEEAAQVLRQALAVREDPMVRGMLAQVEGGLVHERALGRVQSLHFTLHVERGAADRDGRALLEHLERRFTELARTLDYQPTADIPVFLYPNDDGIDQSGAPAWAAATYSHADGAIRVRSADVSRGVDPTLDETLVHELTHAFVAARTRGNVPTEINEGLAQYLSGRRARPVAIDPAAFDGQTVSVHSFYEAALSFVEFLVRRYGQAGLNELLKRLGETSGDEAVRRAFGLGYQDLRKEWAKQLP